MQVFISYSRRDLAFASRLSDDLADYEVKIWLDVRNIPHGANWDNEVQKGLDSSDLMLVLLSPASVSSENVGDEWNYFLEKQKPVLPLLIEACDIPFRLSRRQRVDFTGEFVPAFQELIQALGSPPLIDPESTQRIHPGSTRAAKPTPAPSPVRAAQPKPEAARQPVPPEVAVKMLPIIWADHYHWFNGMRHGTHGDVVINARELALIPRANPIITIPLDRLTTVKIHRSIDQYLKVTYYDKDGAFKSLVMMGAFKERRNGINAEILNLLKLFTKRSLE